MRKINQIFILTLVFFATGKALAQTPTVSCSYTTCVPFSNTNDKQIYSAILSVINAINNSTASTGTVNVSGGNVGGFTAKKTTAVTTNTVAYQSGDNFGGIIPVPLAVRNSSGTAILNDIVIWSTESQAPSITIDIWSASPTGTFTNNSAQVINDVTNYLGSINVSASDYVTLGTISRATISGIGLAVFASSGQNIYSTIVATGSGSPVWISSTNGFTVKYGLLQD